jgi:hypothetical protein
VYRIKPTAKFERTLENLLRAHYKKDRHSKEKLVRLLADLFVKLRSDAFELHGSYPEAWPGNRPIGNYALRKHFFRMPGLGGASGEGRLIYAVNGQRREVALVWIYTHAEFQKRPADEDLRRALGDL